MTLRQEGALYFSALKEMLGYRLPSSLAFPQQEKETENRVGMKHRLHAISVGFLYGIMK